ncbi:glycolate oxidase subunit GlcE, partial [Paracidovorax avenae]
PALGPALQEAARAVGGAATLFRAPEESSEPAAGAAPVQPADAALQRIHDRLRAAFDPTGIFNPGRRVAG